MILYKNPLNNGYEALINLHLIGIALFYTSKCAVKCINCDTTKTPRTIECKYYEITNFVERSGSNERISA